MLVSVIPNTHQLKRYAQSALNGFEDLSMDNAVANAKCELQNLLIYLDRLDKADDAFCESFVSGIERQVVLKFDIRDFESANSR